MMMMMAPCSSFSHNLLGLITSRCQSNSIATNKPTAHVLALLFKAERWHLSFKLGLMGMQGCYQQNNVAKYTQIWKHKKLCPSSTPSLYNSKRSFTQQLQTVKIEQSKCSIFIYQCSRFKKQPLCFGFLYLCTKNSCFCVFTVYPNWTAPKFLQ